VWLRHLGPEHPGQGTSHQVQQRVAQDWRSPSYGGDSRCADAQTWREMLPVRGRNRRMPTRDSSAFPVGEAANNGLVASADDDGTVDQPRPGWDFNAALRPLRAARREGFSLEYPTALC
jgi:hypothetical protein